MITNIRSASRDTAAPAVKLLIVGTPDVSLSRKDILPLRESYRSLNICFRLIFGQARDTAKSLGYLWIRRLRQILRPDFDKRES